MDNYVGKICPFCKTDIKEGEPVTVCPVCLIPHHEGCWVENHGCTTFGCSGGASTAQSSAPADICTDCGAVLANGAAFCSVCGTAKAAPLPKASYCSGCGAILQDEQNFCSVCGQPRNLETNQEVASAINQFNGNIQRQKRKNKRTPAILWILGIVAAIIALVALFSKPRVDSITLDPSSVELHVGETATVECDIYPSEASDAEITWSTSNDDVASVRNGKIIAEGEGSCTITAQAGGKTDTVSVEVSDLNEAELEVVGYYTVCGFFDEYDDFQYLSSYDSTLTLRADLTGTLISDDVEVNFTWCHQETNEDGDHFYNALIEDNDTALFMLADGNIFFALNEITVVFE